MKKQRKRQRLRTADRLVLRAALRKRGCANEDRCAVYKDGNGKVYFASGSSAGFWACDKAFGTSGKDVGGV